MAKTRQIRSWAAPGIFVLAILALLYIARDLLLPIVMALILTLVFAPLVRKLRRLHIPEAVGAALIVISLVLMFIASAYNLAEPASQWLVRAPESIREIGAKLRLVSGPVRNINTAGDQVRATSRDISAGEGGQELPEVTLKAPSLAAIVIASAQKFALSALGTMVLLYFLLASGDHFLRKAIAVTPALADKQRTVLLLHQIESEVSTYLITVTLINGALGCAIALAMYAMGVPNPALWGVMVGLFNFVPYLGDITSFGVLAMVGLLSFDELWRGLLVPAIFCILTAAEGYVIAPMIVGRRLQLNPVVIVLSVLFWGWMWGIFGAILAVPILVVCKSICAHVEPLQAFGEFLEAETHELTPR